MYYVDIMQRIRSSNEGDYLKFSGRTGREANEVSYLVPVEQQDFCSLCRTCDTNCQSIAGTASNASERQGVTNNET